MNWNFFVSGTPIPKGSTKAFVVKGRAITTATNGAKQKPWSSDIAYTAMQEIKFSTPTRSAISVVLTFFMPRPKGHYGSGKNIASVKASAPTSHVSKPDVDKLIRCVLDSLTGVVWHDDSQVIEVKANKRYEDIDRGPGLSVWIREVA